MIYTQNVKLVILQNEDNLVCHQGTNRTVDCKHYTRGNQLSAKCERTSESVVITELGNSAWHRVKHSCHSLQNVIRLWNLIRSSDCRIFWESCEAVRGKTTRPSLSKCQSTILYPVKWYQFAIYDYVLLICVFIHQFAWLTHFCGTLLFSADLNFDTVKKSDLVNFLLCNNYYRYWLQPASLWTCNVCSKNTLKKLFWHL